MTEEAWVEVQEAYAAATTLPPDARTPFLIEVYGNRPDIRLEVESLLEHQEAADRLSQSAVVLAAAEIFTDDGELIGTVVADKYLVRKRLGEGGMAEVYLADHIALNVPFALKRPKLEFRSDPEFRKSFLEEARRAVILKHDNVARVHDVIDVSDDMFVVMEYIDGETLRSRLATVARPFTIDEFLPIALQCGSALAAAHEKRIVHLDVKPENIMLTAAGQVKICDFGIAKRLSPDPSTATTVAMGSRQALAGTPAYMAPEVVLGHTVDERADLFSLGIVFYEMLTGRNPFRADTMVATTGRIVSHTPPPISTVQHDIDPKLERIVLRMLAKEPSQRYTSAAALVEELRAIHRSRSRFQDIAQIVREAFGESRWLKVAAAILLTCLLATPVAWTYRDGVERWLGITLLPDKNTIAVIPFVNEGLPPGSEYLSDGITESLIHTLAQFPNLKVIARSSSFQFKGKERDLQDVARRLHANLLVTGRASEAGGRLRVTAELVNGDEGVQLWGEQYSPTSSDLAGLEARIAKQIAEQIGAKLTNTTQARLSKSTSAKPQAYELLLRGKYQVRLYTPESRQKAIGYFEQALVVDPEFALANAELANVYRLLGGGGILDPAETMPKAEAAARRALAADPDLAEAHSALADITKDQWNWAGAEREYLRAIELNPSLTDAHMGYAILLSVTGRYATALAEVQKVRALDPVGLPAALHAAAVHYNARHYADALEELVRARNLDPSAPSPWSWIGMVYGGSGRYREAVEAYQQAVARGDDTAATQCFYVYSLAKSGQRDQAQKILNGLLKTNQFVPLTAVAVAYTGLDQKERAIQLLKKAYTNPDPLLQYLKVESHFDGLMDRREYADLAAKVGLP